MSSLERRPSTGEPRNAPIWNPLFETRPLGLAGRINIFNTPPDGDPCMSVETERTCPGCGETTTFRQSASTWLHLGEKVKWYCTECDYSIVTIDDAVDTGATA